MNDETPRYTTLSDYLRLFRRRGRLIALFALAGLGLALVLSAVEDPVYTAETQIRFKNPLDDLESVGLVDQTTPDLAPSQQAALNAELVTRPTVTRRAEADLGGTIPQEQLQMAVGTGVNPQTNLVKVEARWGEPEVAAAVANAYAESVRDIEGGEFRARLARARGVLRRQLADAEESLPGGANGAGRAAGNAAAATVADIEQKLIDVRSLAQVAADPVQIVERAQAADAPTSPRPVRNGAIGLLLGAFIGLLVALARDALDRGMKSGQEVRDEIDVPVIGRVPQDALYRPAATANGAGPVLDGSGLEPFRVLQVNLDALDGGKAPGSVMVTGAISDDESSAVSLSLATAAAMDGQRTLLIECNLRNPTLARRVSLNEGPGLADYLRGDVDPEEILQVLKLSHPLHGNGNGNGSKPSRPLPTLACVTAGTKTHPASELLQAPRLRELLHHLESAYDLIVVAAPPLLAVADPLRIASHLDATLVCVRARRTTREQARAVRSALENLPPHPTGAVLTGIRPGDESYGYYRGY